MIVTVNNEEQVRDLAKTLLDFEWFTDGDLNAFNCPEGNFRMPVEYPCIIQITGNLEATDVTKFWSIRYIYPNSVLDYDTFKQTMGLFDEVGQKLANNESEGLQELHEQIYNKLVGHVS
jgi:hypothetical protein